MPSNYSNYRQQSVQETETFSIKFKNRIHDGIADALENPYKALLLLASILLSIASGVTTSLGMYQFMKIFIISVFITFGVQAVLLVTSWKLGYAIATKKSLKTMLPFIFAFFMTAFISMFFSFASLFDFIYDKEAANTANLAAAQSKVEEIITQVREDIIEQRKETIPALLNSPAYQTWRSQLSKVADVASGAKDTLDLILRERAKELAKLRVENEVVLNRSKSQIAQSKKDLNLLPLEIKSIEKKIFNLKFKMDAPLKEETRLIALIKAKKNQMYKEAHGGGTPKINSEGKIIGYTKSGKGPTWQKYNKQKKAFEFKLTEIRNELAPSRALLKRLTSELKQYQQLLAKQEDIYVKATSTLEQSNTTLSQIEDNKPLKKKEILDVDASIRAMTEGLNDFSSTYDYKKFEVAASACDEITTQMNAHSELKGRIAMDACDRQGLYALINPINNISNNLNAFDHQCKMVGIDATTNIRAMLFEDALEMGNKCISLSGLTKNVQKYRKTLDQIRRERGPNVHPFVIALNAVFKDHEPLAMLAFFLAVFMDLLILAASLMGTSVHQPNIDGMRTLLNLSEKSEIADMFKVDLNKISVPKKRDDLKTLLTPYIINGDVSYADKAFVFNIKREIMSEFAHNISEYDKKNPPINTNNKPIINEDQTTNDIQFDFKTIKMDSSPASETVKSSTNQKKTIVNDDDSDLFVEDEY